MSAAKRKTALRVVKPVQRSAKDERIGELEDKLSDLEDPARRAYVAMRLYAESVHAPETDGSFALMVRGGNLPAKWVADFWFETFNKITDDMENGLGLGKDGD